MKTTKSIGLFLLFTFCCINFTACESENNEDDLIWDFYPIVLSISVQDAQGNDLLNPLTKGSIANQGIKALYKGETYEKDVLVERTRAYMAYFYGLQTHVDQKGKFYLTFGEFNGESTFDNEEVIIDWGDNTRDVITFSSKLTWKSKNEPVFDRKLCLNGKEIGEQGLVITKTPSQSDPKFDIIDIQYSLDADADEIKEKIIADLNNESPYTNGKTYSLSFLESNLGTYTLFDSDGTPITKKEFAITEAKVQSTYDMSEETGETFRPIFSNNQIHYQIKLKLEIDSKELIFNIYNVNNNIFWIYEDLTEYYQSKYPDSKIKEVLRLLRSKPNYTIKK